MSYPTPLRAPFPLAPLHVDRPTSALSIALPGVRASIRALTSIAAFAGTLAIAALNEHAPLDIKPGPLGLALAASMPLIAAIVAAYAVERPWPAFAVVLLLTPCWDAAQVSWDLSPVWQVGTVQVVLQTVFIVALALGIVLRDSGTHDLAASVSARGAPADSRPAPTRWDRAARLASRKVGPVATVATVAMLVLATLSTLRSPDIGSSMTVLMHGIFEPLAMGAMLLILATNRRRLALVLVALGLAVALGGAINMIQSIPTFGSLASLQTNRLLFSRLTFFNVGLFGEMLAMAAPLLLGAIAGRRQLGLGRLAVAVLTIALVVSAAALFLTFSKSAYLATAGGIITFVLLLATTWRRRASIVLVSVVLSAFVVPWPALVLQASPTLETAYSSVMISMVGASRYYSWDPSMLSGRGSLVERLLATEAAVRMAVANPILGIGLDQFKTEYVDTYKTPQAHLDLDSAHTFWPEVAAELGIPALALVVLIFALAILALWRVYRAPPDQMTRLLALTLLASLVAWILVATVFAGDMYRPWRNMSSDFVMMAVLVAAAFALSRQAVGRLSPSRQAP